MNRNITTIQAPEKALVLYVFISKKRWTSKQTTVVGYYYDYLWVSIPAGWSHAWHFDESPFSTTIMLQKAEDGGHFDHSLPIRGGRGGGGKNNKRVRHLNLGHSVSSDQLTNQISLDFGNFASGFLASKSNIYIWWRSFWPKNTKNGRKQALNDWLDWALQNWRCFLGHDRDILCYKNSCNK